MLKRISVLMTILVLTACVFLTACIPSSEGDGVNKDPHPVSKTLLNTSIGNAQALDKNDYIYTEWQNLEQKLSAAELVAANDAATQVQINEAKAYLDIAMYELVPDDMAKIDWTKRAEDYNAAFVEKFIRTIGTARYVLEYTYNSSGSTTQQSYLWPHFCTLIMQYRMVQLDPSEENISLYKQLLDGMEYFRNAGTPIIGTGPIKYNSGRSSSVASGRGDVFYDDNIWVARGFMLAYETYNNLAEITEEVDLKAEYEANAATYKDRAKRVTDFVNSGWSTELGGLYWNETGATGANPSADALERGLSANGASIILNAWVHKTFSEDSNFEDADGKEYIEWAYDFYEFCNRLQDPVSYIYYNGIHTVINGGNREDGEINRALYAYNSGSMILADIYLYEVTQEEDHLVNARRSAAIAFEVYCADFEEGMGISNLTNDPWFDSVLVDAFQELYPYDKGNVSVYLDKYAKSFDYGYVNGMDKNEEFAGTKSITGLLPTNVISGFAAEVNLDAFVRDRSALTQSGNTDMIIMIANYYANVLQK